MLAVTKTVYYCEFCKRHRMTAASIERHEPRCIYNPARSKCGWHEPHAAIPSPADYVAEFKDSLDIDQLRAKLDGCPACMLSVVVQTGLTWNERSESGFDYKAEVERFRKEEHRRGAF